MIVPKAKKNWTSANALIDMNHLTFQKYECKKIKTKNHDFGSALAFRWSSFWNVGIASYSCECLNNFCVFKHRRWGIKVFAKVGTASALVCRYKIFICNIWYFGIYDSHQTRIETDNRFLYCVLNRDSFYESETSLLNTTTYLKIYNFKWTLISFSFV